MIINKNVNPEKDLYYIGGILIDILKDSKSKEIDYMVLYRLINKRKEVTINLFSLTLDWLFILGVISKGKNGRIKICF